MTRKIFLNAHLLPVFLASLGPLALAETEAATSQPATTQASPSTTYNPAGKDLPKELTLNLEAGVKMELVLIPAGRFLMGSPDTEQDRNKDEGPQHQVTIPKPFYMGKYVVTQGQWLAAMGNNPSAYTGDLNLPVEQVSWNDGQEFCKKLSAKIGRRVRLPSEAEWEYACRAGATTRFYYGDDLDYNRLEDYAWFASNSDSKTHPVGLKKPNAFGLFDMYGNVCEWCQDRYHNSYTGAPTDGSAWETLEGPDHRVLRGGSWFSIYRGVLRSAFRNRFAPDYRYSHYGFRVVVGAARTP